MKIQSTRNPLPQRPTSAAQTSEQQPKESWLPNRDEVKLGASMLGGGLALGAGGMLLGMEVGVRVASKVVANNFAGQPAPIALLGVIASIPVAIGYSAIGGAAGAALGSAAGSALGYAAYNHFQG